MKKIKTKMNKPVYLGLSILEINKLIMYKLWYNHMTPKNRERVKLCYMDTHITDDVEERFDTSNYSVNRPLLQKKTRKVLVL